MIPRPPKSKRMTHSFPTRRYSDLWKLQPEIARTPPMPIAATRRGRRRLNNTLCCAGLSVGRSENDSGNGPARIAHSDRPAKVASSRQVQTKAAMRSEEHTSELQSLMRISYADCCLKKKNKIKYQ